MQLSFENKSIVVTGASRGIGHAIALSFARAGARVAICARGKEGLDAGAAEIARHAAKVHAAVCDLGDEASTSKFITDAAAALGGIDVLVNNVSASSKGDGEEAWAAAISVDLLGTVRATRAAVPFLERSGAGAIVNISSIRGVTGSARLPVLRCSQGCRHQLYDLPGSGPGRQPYSRKWHRAGLDRISRRALAEAQAGRASPVRGHRPTHSGPAHGYCPRGGECRLVPCERCRKLGHRPSHRRRRRPNAALSISGVAAACSRRSSRSLGHRFGAFVAQSPRGAELDGTGCSASFGIERARKPLLGTAKLRAGSAIAIRRQGSA